MTRSDAAHSHHVLEYAEEEYIHHLAHGDPRVQCQV